MQFVEKAIEAIQSKTIELCGLAIAALVLWILSLVYPAIKRAILEEVPPQVFLPVLLLLLVINLLLFALLIFVIRKNNNSFELRYGVYWDKQRNPYCPVCQKPVVYANWGYQGYGYYCQPCKKVTPLKDAFGNKLTPNQVFDS